MNHDNLTVEKIKEALSFLDYEDRDEWITSAMAVKSELGESGMAVWLDWSSMGSSYKLADAKAVWKSVKATGKVRIGTLIHLAMQRGFKLGEFQPVSDFVKEERRIRREKAEAESKKEEMVIADRQEKKAVEAKELFESLEDCTAHPYTNKKEVSCFGLKSGSWTYKEDGELKVESNALIMPLMTFENGIVSVQAIFADGNKKMMGGAIKSGAFHVIGDQTDVVVIGEGYATCATIHEATGLQVFVALDAGNLIKVAKAVRENRINARIIIAADNDQYKKSNTGLKSAVKAACMVDADIVYPIFRDLSTRPTDFNDLAHLEGLDEVKGYFNTFSAYNSNKDKNNIGDYSAWDLAWIENAEKVLEESSSEIEVAQAAKVVALKLSQDVPAFLTIDKIRSHIDHPLLSRNTHLSIMKQVQWSVFNRKRMAMTAIKPESWGNKHDHVVVSDLSDLVVSSPVTLISAPMGAGKTKKVIKPFSDESDSFLAVAHRRSLISDLSKTLKIQSYDSVKSAEHALSVDKLAVCLPSTQSLTLKPFIDRAYNIAIDEVSQNIRFTSSRECKVNGANQESVFSGLQKIIGESKKIIACDASIDKMTLDFFEASRPDERFTIVEQAPSNKDRNMYLYQEKDAFLTKISIELKNGGKVWLAVESADKAEILSQIFDCEKTILITSKTTKTKKVKDFLENIEVNSREYDLVIASPAISSGVSVEHQKQLIDENGSPVLVADPHFTLIAGMASGHSICFSDFAQMLGRVRYVKDYHIHLAKNNLKNNNLTELSILTGLRQAAAMEGGQIKETKYSEFKAHIEVKEDIYRSDFANGLVWFLEYFCFKVKPGFVADMDLSLGDEMKSLSEEKKEYVRNKIKLARKISQDEYDAIESSPALTEDQSFEITAFKLRRAFRIGFDHNICNEDIDMYENLSKVERFAALLGLKKEYDDSALNISLRSFQDAKIQACLLMFKDFDFDCITSDDCDEMIKRVALNKNRFLLSSLKLVPSCYGEWKEDKSGKLKDYSIPSRTGKSVASILDKFGLSWSRANGRDGNYYKVNQEKYNSMKKYAEMRYS